MTTLKEGRIYPKTLIKNLPKIGPWSTYGLASEALQHYFPEAYDEDGYCSAYNEIQLLPLLGCEYWEDVVIKYQKEVGYKAPNGFNPKAVNEY